MGLYRIGSWNVAIDDGLIELASTRCDLAGWQSSGNAQLEIVQSAKPAMRPLDRTRPESATYALVGDSLSVRVNDLWGAEAAVKAAFQVAILRQGGLLLHASGIAFGTSGALAIGPSGAGKSTLARLASQAGAEVLSDETMGWTPGRQVWPTPFRSDLEVAFGRGARRLELVLLLEKAQIEGFGAVDNVDALAAVLAQVYRPLAEELSAEELLGRVANFLDEAPVQRLSFRKDGLAAEMIRRELSESTNCR